MLGMAFLGPRIRKKDIEVVDRLVVEQERENRSRIFAENADVLDASSSDLTQKYSHAFCRVFESDVVVFRFAFREVDQEL